ncbi:MAG: hypothetical protein M1482_05590 [Chloroflexi bacterium]|nr:hypothetical protein [Chloroflexota bacterium]
MTRRMALLTGSFALVALVLAACSGAATPTVAPVPATVPPSASNASKPAPPSSVFETQNNSSGSVTVDVQPGALQVGKPIAFDIAMNTHSVDLNDDMTKIVVLRDDTGKVYRPMAWDGPGGGGHHRSGTLTFAALPSKPKFVELVIKGLAGVPERVFRWDLQ